MNIITRLKKIFQGNKNLLDSSEIKDNIPEVKELSLDELYPNMRDEEIWAAILAKDEDELTSEELSIKLQMTLHYEHLYGRSLAIKELLSNSYQILDNEHGNPFKELVNFVLLYFKNYIKDNPVDANKLLINSFPLMHQLIYRKIYKQHNDIPMLNNIDEQKAYDEFLIFSKKLFLSLYPNKDIRDKQIKLNFKLLGNDLINFIEKV